MALPALESSSHAPYSRPAEAESRRESEWRADSSPSSLARSESSTVGITSTSGSGRGLGRPPTPAATISLPCGAPSFSSNDLYELTLISRTSCMTRLLELLCFCSDGLPLPLPLPLLLLLLRDFVS